MASKTERQSLYGEVTARIIAKLEAGRLPWVQPWDAARCPCTMPHNAVSIRGYSGINVLILWGAGIDHGYSSQRWLTYRQAEQAGGHVLRGEKGTVVCYADRFTPKDEHEKARGEDREARTVAFLKRFVVFNIDQCEGLPEGLTSNPGLPDPVLAIEAADRVIQGSGADFRIGGGEAFYAPSGDFVQVPTQAAFHEPINWFRTALHEVGHNAASRIMPNGVPQSTDLVGFFSPAIGIIPAASTARSMGSLRSGGSKPHRKSLIFSVLKSAPFGCAPWVSKFPRSRRACGTKIMPNGKPRERCKPSSLDPSSGIIRVAAL